MADVESLPPSYNEILSQTTKFHTLLSADSRRCSGSSSQVVALPETSIGSQAGHRYVTSPHQPNTYSSLLYNSTLPQSNFRANSQSHRPPAYISQIAHQLPNNYDHSRRNIEQRLKQQLPSSFISRHSTLMICISLLLMFLYVVIMYENKLFAIGLPGFASGLYFLVVSILTSRLAKRPKYNLYVTTMSMSIIGLFLMLLSIILNFMLSTNAYCRTNCDNFSTILFILGSSFLSFVIFCLTANYLYKVQRKIAPDSH